MPSSFRTFSLQPVFTPLGCGCRICRRRRLKHVGIRRRQMTCGFLFQHAPVEHVVVSEALAVEQIPEQLPQVTEDTDDTDDTGV